MTEHASVDDTGAELAARVLRSSRRQLLCGSGAVAIAALLSACGTAETDDPTTAPTSNPSTPSGPLATLDQIPVGGGIVTDDLVIVQPKEGKVKAFSRSCPHQHNPVAAPKDGVITCPFHGSQFNATDGSLLHGPATTGLTEVSVKVVDGEVTLA